MNTNVAYFAAGCFWGVEHAFHQVPGVVAVVSGYMNGITENPSYKEICTGTTLHAEAVQVTFQPATVTYEQLVWVFWHLHDPTQLNRQGPDMGTQYRSGIYTTNDEQALIAQASRSIIQAQFNKPVVTEIAAAQPFWPAEEYHQQYFAKNPWRGSCHTLPDIGKVLAECPALNIHTT